jgi:hypothetical protein
MITNLKNFGMEINPDKSSILIRSPITPSTPSTYQVAGPNIKTTKKIKYLGKYLTNGLNRPHIISDRLHQARGISKSLIPFLKKTKPSLNLVKKNLQQVHCPNNFIWTKRHSINQSQQNTTKKI